jgi:hypothetical protein
LFPEYLKAIIGHWNEIFFLSIPTLPFVAWWYLGDPPIWIRVAVFLWVLVIAGYYAWRRDHLILMPKITLRFENRTPFVQMTSVANPEVTLRQYFRLFPDCLSPVESEGYLLRVFRQVDGRWEPTPFNEAVPLTWADGRSGPIKVEPEIGPYLNVFYVETFEKQIVPCLAQPTLRTSIVFRERLKEPRATFRFDIKVTNGTRISLKVKMDERSSHWDRPLVELLPDENNDSN